MIANAVLSRTRMVAGRAIRRMARSKARNNAEQQRISVEEMGRSKSMSQGPQLDIGCRNWKSQEGKQTMRDTVHVLGKGAVQLNERIRLVVLSRTRFELRWRGQNHGHAKQQRRLGKHLKPSTVTSISLVSLDASTCSYWQQQ